MTRVEADICGLEKGTYKPQLIDDDGGLLAEQPVNITRPLEGCRVHNPIQYELEVASKMVFINRDSEKKSAICAAGELVTPTKSTPHRCRSIV